MVRNITIVGMRPKNVLRVSASFDSEEVSFSHEDTLNRKSPLVRHSLRGDVIFCVSFLGHTSMHCLRERARELGLRPHFVRGGTSAVIRKVREALADNKEDVLL